MRSQSVSRRERQCKASVARAALRAKQAAARRSWPPAWLSSNMQVILLPGGAIRIVLNTGMETTCHPNMALQLAERIAEAATTSIALYGDGRRA